jgi:zinc and cadmium transporter
MIVFCNKIAFVHKADIVFRMATYADVIFYSLVGGVFSLVGAIIFLKSRHSADNLAKYATPFAAGALLAAVFLDLLKEAVEKSPADSVMIATLAGIIVFFFAERFLHWFHHHHQHEAADPSKTLIIAGDTLHNALDGVAIAAAFLVSVPAGIVTTVAVAAHEIPQEIGDFGLLLSKGMSRKNVLLVNFFSALATTVAAIVTFALGSAEKLPLGVLLGLSAGFLLYIALSDVIPEIHENASKKHLFDWQPILLVLGIVVVGVSISLSHKYIEPGTPSNEDHSHQEESPGKICPAIYPPPPGC